MWREILCEGREGGGVGEGELGGSALRFTENSQQLVEVCVHAHGRPAAAPAPLGGVLRGGRGGRGPGGVAGGLPCSDKTGFGVLCELALRWQVWERMSWCVKTGAVR